MHIKIKKGLDIPIRGKPEGKGQPMVPAGQASALRAPRLISLNLKPFEETTFKLHARPGDVVKLGQSLVHDKGCVERVFVAPAAGVIKEIRRGHKRRILDIVIEVAGEEEAIEYPKLDPDQASREELLSRLKEGGLFAHIRSRPFNRLADPTQTPRCIFVKAIESAPFVPPAEMQVEGHEEDFQTGLTALSKLTEGSVHLVYGNGSACRAFTEARDVKRHTAEGPHPIGTHSVHIHHIAPIQSPDDRVWTVNVLDVIAIGHLLNTGRYYTDRIVSVAGPGVLPDRVGFFKVRAGYPVEPLIAGRVEKKSPPRFISGDPLMGEKVEAEEFLGFDHTALTVVPENTTREFLHFFRLGINKYSCSRAYLSGHLDMKGKEYDFTTNQHGEYRAFVDSSLYDKVMPLDISTMQLVKAVMAEDYDLAEVLGLLEVDSEDFALPNFVCQCKIEMVDIIKNGLREYAAEVRE